MKSSLIFCSLGLALSCGNPTDLSRLNSSKPTSTTPAPLVGSLELQYADGTKIPDRVSGIQGEEIKIFATFKVKGVSSNAKIKMNTSGNCVSPNRPQNGPLNTSEYWETLVPFREFTMTLPINFVTWFCSVQYQDENGVKSDVYSSQIVFEGSPATIEGSLRLFAQDGFELLGSAPRIFLSPNTFFSLKLVLQAAPTKMIPTPKMIKAVLSGNCVSSCNMTSLKMQPGSEQSLSCKIPYSINYSVWTCGVQYSDENTHQSIVYKRQIIFEGGPN